MDFDDSPEEAEYRAHVRGLLEQHAGELLHVEPGESIDPATHQAEFRATQRVLAEAGLIGIPWPREHGGQGGTLVQQAIAGAGVRPRPHPDADQPHRHRHVRADRHRARQRRPEGSATSPGCCAPTTSGASCSASRRPAPTWPRCAPPPSATATTGSSTARRSGRRSRTSPTTASCSPAPTPTGPSTPGSTMFVVDMHAPGVTVRPLRQMAGGSDFNEVFFDDVRIPDSERLGEPGEGWRVALTTLMNERVAIGGAGSDLGVAGRGARRARPRPAAGPRRGPAGARPPGGRPGGRRSCSPPATPATGGFTVLSQGGLPGPGGQRRQARRHRRRAAGRRRGRAAARRRRGLRDRPPTATTPGSAPRPTCPGWPSPAAPTRCCATSSASGCSACRRNRAPTSRRPFSGGRRDELRPRHRPARRRRRGAGAFFTGSASPAAARAALEGGRARAGAQGAGRDRLPGHHRRRGRRRRGRVAARPRRRRRAGRARCWPGRRW